MSRQPWVSPSGTRLRREIPHLLNSRRVKLLQHRHQQVHHLVKILSVHDAVVRMRIANGDNKVYGRNATNRFLKFRRVVAVALHKIRLQRDTASDLEIFELKHECPLSISPLSEAGS